MAKLTADEKVIQKVAARMGKAILDYGLIHDGDRVLVGLSGGKDSMALVELLGERSKVFRPRFEVVAAHVIMSNIPYRSDISYLEATAGKLGLPLIVREASFDPSTDRRKTPCFLCSWTRRKALFSIAREYGCGKIALGHHQDDVLVTLLMNMAHQGAFATMPPKLRMDKFPMEIIRPLCLVEERDLARLAAIRGYRPQTLACPYETASARSGMREILARIEALGPEARHSLWRSMTNVRVDYLPRLERH